MANVSGTYEVVSTDNFDEYLKAQGVNAIKRKIAAKISPKLEIVFDGTTFTQKTITSIKTTTLSFKIGEEYEQTFEETGVTKKLLCTMEGDEITVREAGKDEILAIRKFTADGMHLKMIKGDVVATRVFKRVK